MIKQKTLRLLTFAALSLFFAFYVFVGKKSALADSNQSSYPYIIAAKHSGQCLNILDASQANGAPAVQGKDCGGTPNFLWKLIEVGQTSGFNKIYNIKVQHSGQYLNVLDGSRENGAPVVQGTDNTTNNFEWVLEVTDEEGLLLVRNIGTGQCLNVLGGDMRNGAPVVQGVNCATDNFKWAIRLAGRR